MKTEHARPRSIGFIMDGNRRWATARGLSFLEGHKEGAARFKEACRWVEEFGVAHAVFYAFSTENWHRPPHEVDALLALFRLQLEELARELKKQTRALRFIGQRERFSKDLQTEMDRIESGNPTDVDCTVWIALSYGGRAEIVAAANRAVEMGVAVTEETFASLLTTADMPDPDLIIRTGGEERLSNFLPWQSIYSELFFSDTLWPDFSREEFQGILEAYGTRRRRNGT